MRALGICREARPSHGCAACRVVTAQAGPRAAGTQTSQSKSRKKAPDTEISLGESTSTVPAAPTPPPASSTAAPGPAARQETALVDISLAYSSGWERPLIHYSLAGGGWQVQPLATVPSGGGQWKDVSFRVNGASTGEPAEPLLEFVITDGNGSWDNAPDGSNYALTQPGRYVLRGGSLAAPAAPAVLVVTDLDDTLVGDDAATAAFLHWWHDQGVPAGGRLVANTGRALDLFLSLLAEKGHVMPVPDMLVSALGTRIYTVRGGAWHEDEAYTASLGEGWNLEAVREACYATVAEAGREAMHFRPAEEMNDHKITCGCRNDALQQAVSRIRTFLDGAGVGYKLVVSGSGGWRFVDLVPPNAGKLHALEYARQALGFPQERTVACGDSGNDIAMLEGKHKCIVVGNAQPDLLEWVEQQRQQRAAVQEGQPFEILVTRGHRAWGILEGLEHFGFKHG